MRIKTCLFLLTFFSLSLAFSQKDSARQNDKSIVLKAPENEPNNWYDSKAMPWIVSLTIAVITVFVNIWISYSQRRTSLKVVQSQIESATNLARAQFQFTLNSKNRQDWITELRNCISEFATYVRQMNIYLQGESKEERAFLLHEKVFLYRSKIKLLLNNTKEEHTAFHKAQEELMDILEIHLLTKNSNKGQFNNHEFIIKLNFMIEKGRDLLYHEWQRVQEAQAAENKPSE